MHKHGVTYAYVETLNIIGIVERCVCDRGSGKTYRLNDGLRRQNARPSYLHHYVNDTALFLFGWILVCNRPPRGLCGTAERRTLRKGVDLYNGSVDVVCKFVPMLSDPQNALTAAVDAFIDLVRHNGKTHVLHGVKSLGVTVKVGVGAILHIKAHDVKLP